MAVRPLYNGSARVAVDNGQAGALRVAFAFRVSTAAIDPGVETIANSTFEAEAGVGIVLNWDVRKFGDGVEVGTPDFAIIRVFLDDDSNDGRTGEEANSGDLINAALPLTGTYTFTPTKSGTYRIALEMQKDNADFGAASDDWRALSDGSFQRGGIAGPTQASAQDKGRLRYGAQVTAYEVTKQDGAAAPNPFAFVMNAGGTAAAEGARITTTQSHDSDAIKLQVRQNIRHLARSTRPRYMWACILSASAYLLSGLIG